MGETRSKFIESRLSGLTFANEVVFGTVPSSSLCNLYGPAASDEDSLLNVEASLLQTPARRPAISPIRFLKRVIFPIQMLERLSLMFFSYKPKPASRNLQLSTTKDIETSLVSLSKSTNAEELEEAEQEARADSEISATRAQLNLIQ